MKKIGHAIITSIIILIILTIFTEICAFCFWANMLPDRSNGPEVLVASLYTIRLFLIPIVIVCVTASILCVNKLITRKRIAFFLLSLFIFTAIIFVCAHWYVCNHNIDPLSIVNILIGDKKSNW